ncbi:MAG: hypothetical protein PSV35_00710, partial [bacterium]|nr:hypothetical protein [bacterium]
DLTAPQSDHEANLFDDAPTRGRANAVTNGATPRVAPSASKNLFDDIPQSKNDLFSDDKPVTAEPIDPNAARKKELLDDLTAPQSDHEANLFDDAPPSVAPSASKNLFDNAPQSKNDLFSDDKPDANAAAKATSAPASLSPLTKTENDPLAQASNAVASSSLPRKVELQPTKEHPLAPEADHVEGHNM